ncbi:MAG: cytochrome c [Candidatus Bathyarchaeia archaeon]
MVSKSIIAIAAIAIMLVIGGIYFIQQPYTPSITPTSTSTQTTPTPTTPTETPTTPKTTTTTPNPTPTETPKVTPNNATEGEKLYIQNCAGCHGTKGVGALGPALSAKNVDRNLIENGIAYAGMPVFKKILTPEEITAIINFLKS